MSFRAIRPKYGLSAQRGWARLILGCFHDLVLSPGGPTAATREPDSVSHEHQTLFIPDTGRDTANTAGFGWQKRPFLHSGSPCCVSTNFLLGGRGGGNGTGKSPRISSWVVLLCTIKETSETDARAYVKYALIMLACRSSI